MKTQTNHVHFFFKNWTNQTKKNLLKMTPYFVPAPSTIYTTLQTETLSMNESFLLVTGW